MDKLVMNYSLDKRNCGNFYYGGCGNIINNRRTCFCKHPWGETNPDKLLLGTTYIKDKFSRQDGVLEEDLAEEIDCQNHIWDSWHPMSKDHQPKLFEGVK